MESDCALKIKEYLDIGEGREENRKRRHWGDVIVPFGLCMMMELTEEDFDDTIFMTTINILCVAMPSRSRGWFEYWSHKKHWREIRSHSLINLSFCPKCEEKTISWTKRRKEEELRHIIHIVYFIICRFMAQSDHHLSIIITVKCQVVLVHRITQRIRKSHPLCFFISKSFN